MTPVIVDTSAILAAFDEGYDEHTAVAETMIDPSTLLVVSPMVVAEADYMLLTRLGRKATRQFGGDVAAGAYQLASWDAGDHASALGIIDRFSADDSYIGVADASNVVLADRYRTTTLLSLDQRHFRQLRPLDGLDYFTLLPYDT